MKTIDYPRRHDGLDVHEVEDGYVIYDESTQRVHYLNPTAVLVFELCTGAHTEAEIVALVGRAFGLTDLPVNDVADCLSMLRREQLVSG
jgi:alpha-N-acetylglucosamine transferase